jgi:ketosteroid isomerase-like protein
LALLMEKDMDGFSALWAASGIMEFPFAPPNAPRRLEGREAVAQYLKEYPSRIDLRRYTALEIHECLDPELIVLEMSVTGVVVATSKPYDVSYIAVIRVRDGEIASYRDYWNPLAIGYATDRLDAMVASMRGSGS